MSFRTRLFSAGMIGIAAAAVFATQASGAVVGRGDRDTSRKVGSENECAVAVNPVDRRQVFVSCNTESAGLYAARSVNGGATWIYPDPVDKTIADGDAGQGPSACCDPTLAWDSFGNLYLGYLNAAVSNVTLLRSTDGGATFTTLKTFAGSVDQPTVVAANTSAPGAPVAVWIVWNQGSMRASGAAVTGLGVSGAFSASQIVPGASGCSFGDVAIAPSGAVVQVCQTPTGGQGPGTIRVNTDADGLGPGGFNAGSVATSTNVGGFDFIPAQNSRSVDAEAGLAYDRLATSAHFGRLYMVYTDETANENNDLDIMVRFSDNDGTTWSDPPIRVNDDGTVRSQFLPRISSDPKTGKIAVCWHDARNSGTNVAMEVFCSVAPRTGATPTFAPNGKIGDGPSVSNASAAVEFGDYSGLDYFQNIAIPVWADTSNSNGLNPDGTADFDAMVDRVTGP